VLSLSPTEFDDEILTFDVAEIAQARPQRLYSNYGSGQGGGCHTQESDSRRPWRRMLGERLKRRDEESARDDPNESSALDH
jgi:hypothetical protein